MGSMEETWLYARRQATLAWNHRWKGMAFCWLACLLGWSIVFFIPNQYEASARIYVDADAILTPLLKGVAADTSDIGQVDLLQRTLLSRPNLDKLISKTALDARVTDLASREALITSLATDVKMTPQTKNLFTISYRDTSAQLAYDVVKTMLVTFIESRLGSNRTDVDNAARFVNDQISTYERQLRQAESRRADFRSKYVDLIPQDGGGASKLDAQSLTVRQLQGQLQDARMRKESLNQVLSTTPETVVTERDPAEVAKSQAINPRLQDAERNLADLRTKYTENSPDVVSAKSLVATLRSTPVTGASNPSGGTPGRSRSVPNPLYEQLKVRLVENEGQISSLSRQVQEAVQEKDRIGEVARGAPGLQAEYENINRDYSILRRNYDDLVTRREAMRISSAADLEGDKLKVQVVDPPVLPRIPAAPKRILLVTGVLVAAIAAGSALAFVLVQMDTSFHGVEDLRSLGFQVVGGISILEVMPTFSSRLFSGTAFLAGVSVPIVVYCGLLVRLLRPIGVL